MKKYCNLKFNSMKLILLWELYDIRMRYSFFSNINIGGITILPLNLLLNLIPSMAFLEKFHPLKNVFMNPSCLRISTFLDWQNMWYTWTFVANYMLRLSTASPVSMSTDKHCAIMKCSIKFYIFVVWFWSRAVILQKCIYKLWRINFWYIEDTQNLEN